VPVLASPSRKSFLRALTGRDITRSGPATLAAEIFAAWQGANFIRTHDVAAARDAFTVLAAIAREAATSPVSSEGGTCPSSDIRQTGEASASG
jgi:dihydropteroate synthase type 2